MTLILACLLIAGHSFQWWWFLVGLLVDIVWLSLKLNFMAALMRRSVEQTLSELAEASSNRDLPPPPAPPAA